MTPNPDRDFPDQREAWEGSVIANADYFTSVRFLGRNNRDRRQFPTLEEAARDARPDPCALVYAVTKSGRATLVTRDLWPAV